MSEDFRNCRAIVSALPAFSGDGYGYGGSAVLTIGGRSLMLGEGSYSHEMAEVMAERWNAALIAEERGTNG